MKRWLLLLIILCSSVDIEADEPGKFSEEQLAFFEAKIRPVLFEHCYECHAADAKIVQGGLRVDDRASLLAGGDSGAAVVPMQTSKSLLLSALRYEEFNMPPKGRLPDSIVRDFETWIEMGAPDPREAIAEPRKRTVDLEQGRKHWAFQPMIDTPVPIVQDVNWPLVSLDRYILASMESSGVKPVNDVDRFTWLRRVSLDLTGLPPSPSEIDAFINDQSPGAFESVVDRLLDSRAFGERWARHWLDLTGYADMMGTSNDVFAEHAWRYRDYLIEAFRKDKPFDRFVREQIAGDLLLAESTEERAENIVATGFLMVGDVEIVEPDKAKLEADHIDTQMIKIGVSFLGMTLGCVRCHDHKFDPITTSEYYGIAGMLRSSPSTHKIPFGVWSSLNTTELPETMEQLAVRQKLEAEHEKSIASMVSEREKLEIEKKQISEELAQIEKAAVSKVAVNGEAESKEWVEANAKKESLAKLRDELSGQIQKLGPAIQHAEFFRSKVPRAFAMRDSDHPADMPIYIRGNPYAPANVVPRGTIQVASWEKFPDIPAAQSGRLQLAEWLADRRNPLTARVAVNRIWQKLFGEGLVRSIDYFGTRGEPPSHPELLDYLALRLIRNGWSQKQLIRTLVLSRTYRLGSMNDEHAMQVDPDNRLFWRMNRQRLDAEAIRDSLLAVSGELMDCAGGPALVLEELENCGSLVQQGVNPPNYSHRKARPQQEFQRSIYLPVMRTKTNNLDRIRTHFDFINPAQISGQRPQTVVPTQVLFMMNNELFRKRAKVLADRLVHDFPQIDTRLEQLWLCVLNRPISEEERTVANSLLAELKTKLSTQDGNDSRLWIELCHGLLASNEFIFRL